MELFPRRCDFCETTLKTDLEVSHHLISDKHKDNVKKFIKTQPQNPKLQRNPCKNIADIYKALRIRTKRDVCDLAEKGYFTIPEDSGLLSVAQKLSVIFLNAVAEHRLRDSSHKSVILDGIKQSSENFSRSYEPITDSTSTSRGLSPDDRAATSGQTSLPMSGCITPAPSIPSMSNNTAAVETTPSLVSSETWNRISRLTTNSEESSRHSTSIDGGETTLRLTPTAPGAATSIRSITPRSSNATSSRVTKSVSHASTSVRSRSLLPGAQTSTRPTLDISSGVTTKRSETGVLSSTPLPPMAGANNFIPQTRPAKDDKPRPRPNSTYTPQLAKIKVEPKDN